MMLENCARALSFRLVSLEQMKNGYYYLSRLMAAIGQLLHNVNIFTVHIQAFICFLQSHPVLDTGMIEVFLYLNENMCLS